MHMSVRLLVGWLALALVVCCGSPVRGQTEGTRSSEKPGKKKDKEESTTGSKKKTSAGSSREEREQQRLAERVRKSVLSALGRKETGYFVFATGTSEKVTRASRPTAPSRQTRWEFHVEEGRDTAADAIVDFLTGEDEEAGVRREWKFVKRLDQTSSGKKEAEALRERLEEEQEQLVKRQAREREEEERQARALEERRRYGLDTPPIRFFPGVPKKGEAKQPPPPAKNAPPPAKKQGG